MSVPTLCPHKWYLYLPLPAQTPSTTREKMISSKALATLLMPMRMAGTIAKTLLISRVPFLQGQRVGGCRSFPYTDPCFPPTSRPVGCQTGENCRRGGGQEPLPYLPHLSTIGPTISAPRKPPRGNMDTVQDHRSNKWSSSRPVPWRSK